jgi:hypothetical protein
MTYRLAGNRQVTTVVRVSGDTRRPDTATIQAEDGLRLVCRFDYPEFGPRDAYELGVPREVPVIDRVPAPDLQRIIAGVTDGRRRFDAYYCVLVHSNAAHHWSRTNRLYRTWRKGDCWRIEQSFSDPQDDEELWGSPLPAENVDRAQYWFERARRTRFYPVIVCDGRHVFRFKHEFSDPAQKRITFQTARAERDYMDYDPSFAMLPLYTPAPELEGHCATLGGAGPRVVERLIADPVDGPPGTVLVEREYSGRRGQADKQDLDRFWIDPVNGFLVMRYEMVDLDRDVPEVMQSRQVLSFNRSPSGYFYPTLLRWDQSGLAHYYVDFEAKFDDVIFQPDATAAVRQD